MKTTHVFGALLSLLVMTRPVFAESDRYLGCEGDGIQPVSIVFDSASNDARTQAEITYYDALDSGAVLHHTPIYLPGKQVGPLPLTVRTDGPRTYFESEDFQFVIKLMPLDYSDGVSEFDGVILKASHLEGLNSSIRFRCTWRKPVVISPPYNPPQCHFHCH